MGEEARRRVSAPGNPNAGPSSRLLDATHRIVLAARQAINPKLLGWEGYGVLRPAALPPHRGLLALCHKHPHLAMLLLDTTPSDWHHAHLPFRLLSGCCGHRSVADRPGNASLAADIRTAQSG